MAIVEPLSLKKSSFHSVNNDDAYRFPVPNVVAGTDSDEIKVSVERTNGVIHGVRASNLSHKYTISIRTSAGVVRPSIDEVYRLSAINKTCSIIGLSIPFVNNDSGDPDDINPFLYIVVSNNDISEHSPPSASDTGIFDIELLVRSQ